MKDFLPWIGAILLVVMVAAEKWLLLSRAWQKALRWRMARSAWPRRLS